jgi:hypothetical protein
MVRKERRNCRSSQANKGRMAHDIRNFTIKETRLVKNKNGRTSKQYRISLMSYLQSKIISTPLSADALNSLGVGTN